MAVINFIINNILTQAFITIGLIAFIGLLAQKKSFGDIVSGTFKTMLGYLVLSAGSSIIVNVLVYFGEIFTAGFGMQGIVPSIEAVNGQAMNELGLGNQIAFAFLGIFLVNIIIARLTKWKYIFLTGQAILWMATMVIVFGSDAGLGLVPNVIIGSIIGGIFAVAMPAVAQPIVRKITGSDEIALGHFCTIGYLFASLVSKITGNKENSTEDIELPSSLSFLNDTYLSVGFVMILLFIITAIFAGPEVVAERTGSLNYIVYAFTQGMQFVVGVYILLAGVRLLLGEIVPAFRGIALKIVPDAKPALDCPVLFPYAPNAVTLGFVSTTIGTVIGMLFFPKIGLAMLLPGMLSNFFAGGTAGIFCNETGGVRGTIIGGIAHGLFITFLPALLVMIFNSMGFVNATATDVDTVAAALLYAWIIKPIVGVLGV